MDDLFSELKWRGQINQTTDDENLPAFLMAKPRTVYAGFDPTADSLHVGHMIALMFLRRYQRAGHRPLALVGGATGMIGDPSGRSSERVLLDLDTIQHNVDCIKTQMRRFLDFDNGPNKAEIVNNYDWMGKITYLEFLRDIGKLFSVNAMLAKDSVKKRIESESGISYTEFSYMLLQSYDFVHLFDAYGCEIEIGGSDQWGNIATGCELVRRMRNGQVYGMTCPLLTKSDGTKMGKSVGGALWLDESKTSAYTFYQYWINIDDADVEKVLKLFSDKPEAELREIVAAHLADPGRRIGQKEVAQTITQLVHGEEGLGKALKATEIFFGAEIEHLSDAELSSIFADVPGAEITSDELNQGLGLLDAFVKTGLAKSKGEARRTVEQGGAYVNNRKVTDPQTYLNAANLASETTIVLRSGKKKYALLKTKQ